MRQRAAFVGLLLLIMTPANAARVSIESTDAARMTAIDLIRIETCLQDWNTRLHEAVVAGRHASDKAAIVTPDQSTASENGHISMSNAFNTKALPDLPKA